MIIKLLSKVKTAPPAFAEQLLKVVLIIVCLYVVSFLT
jgi:hypothetical protein